MKLSDFSHEKEIIDNYDSLKLNTTQVLEYVSSEERLRNDFQHNLNDVKEQIEGIRIGFKNLGLDVNTQIKEIIDALEGQNMKINAVQKILNANTPNIIGSVDLLSHFTKVKCDSWT